MSRGRNQAESPPTDDRAERAERVRAMLDRWSREEEAGEPDWDVSELTPLSLRDSDQPSDAGE